MTDKELIKIAINNYSNLQRIKKSLGDIENEEVEYQIKLAVAELSSYGVNVKDITL